MSRHIQTGDPNIRKLNNDSQKGKLLLTHINERTYCCLLQADILISAHVMDPMEKDQIGEIYIGKVKNILHNIQAYFIEIADGQICYLSFRDARSAYLLNRRKESVENKNDSSVLIQGDELPVQVIRNEIKTKPSAVSTALELQSEYFVFQAGSQGIGVSNKINLPQAQQIRQLLQPHLFSGKEEKGMQNYPEYGVIVRTKCGQLDQKSILEEYQKLEQTFLNIYQKAAHRTCFSCIKANPSNLLQAVAQVPIGEYEEIITDQPNIYEELTKSPLSVPIRLYQDETFPLFKLYGLQTKLEAAYSKKVWLKSGANLVIEQTECLTAVDVNSSKNIKGKNTEDRIFQINMEAAAEAARQIRLRNLSGIIIIDFINMKDKEKENILLKYLRECTARDPVTTKVVDITPLGLVEITRKKVSMSLKEQMER